MAGQDRPPLHGNRKIVTDPDYLSAVTGPIRYVDGAVGTPNDPVPPPGNPYIDPATGLPYSPSGG